MDEKNTPRPSDSDPLANRLRATFQAERDDLARRHAASPVQRAPKRTTWLPLAVAAAVIALAGFAFIATRPSDEAVRLDVAEQGDTNDDGSDDSTDDDSTDDDSTDDDSTDDSEAPTPGPTAEPTPSTATSTAGDVDPDDPATLDSENAADDPPDEPAPLPSDPPDAEPCPTDAGVHFVWNVAVDDPDGGLIAHTAPGVDEPVTRVLPLNEVVTTTGNCRALQSTWFELESPTGTDWVSGNFLSATTPACLFGEAIGRTPGQDGSQQVFGPLEGHSVVLGDVVAFAAAISTSYQFFGDTATIAPNTPCYFVDGIAGPVCVNGALSLIDPFEPEPVFGATGPIDVTATGRQYLPLAQRGLAEEWIEVLVETADGTRIGFFDPAASGYERGTCASQAGPPIACQSFDGLAVEETRVAGVAESTADHVHDIQFEDAQGCNRIVITFGSNVDVANASHGRPELLPPVEIITSANAVRVNFPTCADLAPEPCSFSLGELPNVRRGPSTGAFVAADENDQPYVQVLAPGPLAVTWLESPARMVIDWPGFFDEWPEPLVADDVSLRERLPTINDGNNLTVSGWAQPFEAQGEWYVIEVDQFGDLPEIPAAIASGGFRTTAWIVPGEFTVNIEPDLPDGDYAVLFGERPPGGDADTPFFIGSGQFIRVDSAGDAGPPPWQSAVIDRIAIFDPILILDG